MSMAPAAAAPTRPVGTVAIASGAGVLGDAIGVELFNAGITVVDAGATAQLIARAGLQEYAITSTQGYEALREKGIEAILAAKAVAAADGTPESASVRVTDTASGKVLAGLTWQNGWGGQRGSVVDRTMRKNLADAAKEIASGLLTSLRPKP